MTTARPILFSAPMVRALLEGRKTQTRRLMKPQPPKDYRVVWHEGLGAHAGFSRLNENFQPRCPYGVSGDLLWVRESWWNVVAADGASVTAPGTSPGRDAAWYVADMPDYPPCPHYRKRPGIHMPRWASRLTLEITGVRVERLQNISEEDAIAEGVTKIREACHVIKGFDYDEVGLCHTSAVTPYYKLWEHLNGRGSWDANPWVVALSFTVHKQNVDAVLSSPAAKLEPAA